MNFLKIFTFLSLLYACSNNSISNTSLKTCPLDWLIYEGSDFTMYYPKSWELDVSKNLQTELVLHSFMDKTDSFRENIVVEKYKLEDSLSKENFIERIHTRLKKEADVLYSQLQSQHYINAPYIFHINLAKQDLKIILYVFLQKDTAYILNFTQKIDTYVLEETALKIMESFSLKT